MNKNVKVIIIIVVLLIIAYLVYRFAFKNKNLVKGYAKKPGDWVACQVKDFDSKNYQGYNTAGVQIIFKKDAVKTRPGKDTNLGQCADAVANLNVYTLKA
jgi:hypothetical protein